MASVLKTQIPSTHSRLGGIVSSKEKVQDKILKLLQQRPHTPTQLAIHFNHKSRAWFSTNYLYPLRDSNKIEKIKGSNYYQLKKQKKHPQDNQDPTVSRLSNISDKTIFKLDIKEPFKV